MSKNTLIIIGLIFLAVTLGCRSFIPSQLTDSRAPDVDFVAAGKPLNVKVELDKTQTAAAKISSAGGTVSLTSANGSKFELEVPADALEAETEIVMTAVKTLDGSPLDGNTPTAVQLEPSGLFFNEFATLTIVPAKEIPIEDQIIFGYEGDGQEYHLAVVDPASKEIKIKLNHFSGAGVGSGADSAWAAHLQIQAEAARSRLGHELGKVAQAERQRRLLGDESGSEEFAAQMEALLDKYEDQVILKEMAAAELDCQFARKAYQDMITLERQRRLLGFQVPGDTYQKLERLVEIGKNCKKAYRITGSSNGVNFTGQACGLDKPFLVDATFPGGTAKFTFTPSSPVSGSSKTDAGGSGCTMTGGGEYSLMLSNDGSGKLKLNTTDTVFCQGFSNTRTNNFTLSLQSAPDVKCQ